MRRRPNRRLAGFSLVELLTVMAILAIMLGVLLPVIAGARHAATQAHCASNLRQVGNALHSYFMENSGRLPKYTGANKPTPSIKLPSTTVLLKLVQGTTDESYI